MKNTRIQRKTFKPPKRVPYNRRKTKTSFSLSFSSDDLLRFVSMAVFGCLILLISQNILINRASAAGEEAYGAVKIYTSFESLSEGSLTGNKTAFVEIEPQDYHSSLSNESEEAVVNEETSQESVEDVQDTETTQTSKVHVVKSGDTLYGIALDYDLSFAKLAEKNSIEAPYKLKVGQEIALEL